MSPHDVARVARVLAALSPWGAGDLFEAVAAGEFSAEPRRLGVTQPQWLALTPGERPRLWHAWRHADAEEALEALQTAGLAPPPDPLRRWWCAVCWGRGRLDGLRRSTTAPTGPHPCPFCADGATHAPAHVPTLAAVAALGHARWLRAEALARVVAPGAEVRWRAMSRDAFEAHHAAVSLSWRDADAGAPPAPEAAFTGYVRAGFREGRWRGFPAAMAARAPMADLHAMGVHVVDSAPASLTLAAGALP